MTTSHPLRVIFFAGLLLATASTSAAPLTDEQRTLFLKSREDPPAEFLKGVREDLAGKSFVVGNEGFLDRFAPAIEGLGGGYVGVGAEQAWLFIGWQKPELAWLTDYDPNVSDIHRIQMAFFAEAPDYLQWRALWELEAAKWATQVIMAHAPRGRGHELVGHWRTHRAKVRKRLDEMAAHFGAVGAKAFFTDFETYRWVRQFVLEGRARPMTGDLYGEKGLRGIAKAAAALKVPIRVVYLSNAEEYDDYHSGFVPNMNALAGDDKAVVLRTSLTWTHNQDYRYIVQPLADFVTWLAQPNVIRVGRMLGKPEEPLPIEPVLTRFSALPTTRTRPAP